MGHHATSKRAVTMSHHASFGSVATMNDDPVGFLRGVPLFARVDDKGLALLAQRVRRRTFRRNEVIMHRGDPAGSMHVIFRGRVKVTLASEVGEETVLRIW